MPDSTPPKSNRRIGLILLAAGASTRMGVPKQLLALNGVPLIQRSINAAAGSGCRPLIAVLGSEHEKIRAGIIDSRVQIEIAADWEEGISASIRAGLRRLLRESPAAEAVILMLCDQPDVGAVQLRKLIDPFTESGAPLVASHYQNQSGVPALFSRKYFDELQTLSGTGGAKRIIEAHADDLLPVEMPEAAYDVDVPEDLRRFRGP